MTVRADTDQSVVRASTALVVAVTINGAVLPRYDEEPEVALGLAGLLLVAGLSRPEPVADLAMDISASGAADTVVNDLLGELRRRNLLTERPLQAHGARRSEGDGPRSHAGQPRPEPAASFAADEALLVMPNPVLLGCVDGDFTVADHEGRVRARLSAVELAAMVQFRLPATRTSAWAAHRAEAGELALDEGTFATVVDQALAATVLVPFDPDHAEDDRQARQADLMKDAMRRKAQVSAAFERLEADQDERGGAPGRVPVIGVHTNWSSAPAGLGVVIAHARRFDDGVLSESFDFRPRLVWDERLLTAASETPSVFLFSNYVWSTKENLELSALVKGLNPGSVTVHGGPDTPKYGADVERYFADHPHVDVAVHGEGEQTFAELLAAIRGQVGDEPIDLSVLADVPGLSFRAADGVVTSAKRDRIADVDTIPSPILMGIFDGFVPAGPAGGVALETNRGCPYGCTFCDWGSATLSRVRKFDLDRVFAELEWCARNQIQTVGIADANFGIFERDVEIAEKIAELKATYGYPESIGNNYAKNTVKHLSKIIEIFTEAGIVAEGKMSMQSFDAGTLSIIRRKNIKVEKYDELSVEFRRNELPLSVDLMLGLPGSTPETFRNDLQACVDRDVRALIQPTMLLPNSPMNEPEYREEHGIVARPGEYVRETASYTRAEWDQMHRLGAGLWLFENFGILRQVAGYVRGETGTREVDFYEHLIEDAERDPEAWPLTSVIIRVLPNAMVPPVSWRYFLDEIRRRVVEVDGVAEDNALETVLRVQHALLPARDRVFPLNLELDHDYVTWRRSMLEARDRGHLADWPTVVAPLRTLGPGVMVVDDPHEICTTALDGSLAAIVHESSWDFESPVSRPRQRSTTGRSTDGDRQRRSRRQPTPSSV
jgi:radical SAM superfamily enzyme YgiQ (UPF0313 family)